MTLTPGAVPAAAVAFPTKFLDSKDHHVALAGADAFGRGVPSRLV
jgi:hypothetical protein